MGKETRPPQNDFSRQVARYIRRKQMKPITEKNRRERINNSLHELKDLVLSARNKDVMQYAKMEKAEILDMAVKYIKCIQAAQQETRVGCHGSTQEKPASRSCPSDKAPINTKNASHQQSIQIPPSKTIDIDSEDSWPGGLMTLVQPDTTHPAQITIATQKNHALSSNVHIDYIPIPSSGFSNDLHQSSTTSTWENSPSNYTNSICSRPKLDKSVMLSKMRSTLAEKQINAFTTETTKRKTELSMSFKFRHSNTEHEDNVRLPGMECFVKDTFMSEQYKENYSCNGYSLVNQQVQLQLGHVDNSQYLLYSPLWRPW